MYVYVSAHILGNYIAEDVWKTRADRHYGGGEGITYILLDTDTNRTSPRTSMHRIKYVTYVNHMNAVILRTGVKMVMIMRMDVDVNERATMSFKYR